MDKIGIVFKRIYNFPYPENFLKIIDNLAAIAATSSLLIKIVKEKNSSQFLKRLKISYCYRPNLRIEPPKDATHKYHHLTGGLELPLVLVTL